MKKLPASLIIAAGAIWLLCFSYAQAGQNCASLVEERKNVFQEHRRYVTQARVVRSWLGELNTVDPALINKRLKQWTAQLSDLRKRRDNPLYTPAERKVWADVYVTAQQAYDFWQAKKAHEETGGMVDAPAAPPRYIAALKKSLKEIDASEKASSDKIAALDEEIKKCEGAGRTATSSPWSGTWSDGTGGTVQITVSGETLSYTYEIDGKPYQQGRCTIHGTAAACQWNQQVSEEHNGAQVTRITSGYGSMTLAGSQIRVHFITDKLNFNPSCPSLDCGPPKPGFVSDFGLIRKH